MKLKLNEDNISLIINNIEDTLNLLIYQNNFNDKQYDETLSNFFQISIMNNLLKELLQILEKIEIKEFEQYSLDSKELLSKDKNLKQILLKMRLLLALLNDEELFTDKMNYKIYDYRFKNSIGIIKCFIDNPTKKGFLKFIKGCSKYPESFEIIDFFFPKHKFYKVKNYDLIILYINTICELIRNNINFSIEIDKQIFSYLPNKDVQYGRIQPCFCLNKEKSFILTAGTKISIPLKNVNKNEIEINKRAEDSETLIKFVQEYAPKKDLNKQISEIFLNFQKKKRNNKEKEKYFTSLYFFDPQKNNNIFSRAWSIIYGLNPNSEVYKFLFKYYFDKERKFFEVIEQKYNSLKDLNQIDELIEFLKKRFFYYNKNSFLWMDLIKKKNIDANLNKDDINSKLIDIRKEISNIKILENNSNELETLNEDKMILIKIQQKLEKLKNKIEIDEKYIKAEEELNKLKNDLDNLKVQETFKIWKTNLKSKINDAFNLKKDDMINIVDSLKKDYESLVSINEEKTSEYQNNIDWKIPSIKNVNEKSSHIQLFDIILQYSSSLEIIKKIDSIKMTNDKSKVIKLSSHFQGEFKSLIKYIISLQNYQNFNIETANSMCRASLMLKIFKNKISIEELSNFFKDLDEKKNRFGQVLKKECEDENERKKDILKNKLLQDEFIYIYTITGIYDLNMDIIIPNFKLKDIIYLFFSFESNVQYYYGPAFDNIDIINRENLYEKIYKNIEDEIKDLTTFKDIAGKISLMFYSYFNRDFLEIPKFINGDTVLKYIEDNNKLDTPISDEFKMINVLIEMIQLGTYFDEYTEKKKEDKDKELTFEDFKCFEQEFNLNSILQINNLPSFQYFLLKNYNNIEILLKTVKSENIHRILKPSPYIFIPFWIFIIRIMSSTNCLIFENDKNPLEKELTKIIREKILFSMQNNKNTNLSWINLITDDIKYEEIFNKKINMFYVFFNKICTVKINCEQTILKYINILLLKFYELLFDINLSNQFNDLLNSDINSGEFQVLNFIKNPKEFIKNFINSDLSKNILTKLEEPNCLNYDKSLEEFIETINDVEKNIKQKVENLEEKLLQEKQNDIIKTFKNTHKREMSEKEKEEVFSEFEPQKIYFNQNTVESVIVFLRNIKSLLNQKLNYIKKIKNKEDVDVQEFNYNYEKLKVNLEHFNNIYEVEESYCDEDFTNYLDSFQKSVNTFINNFNNFSEKFKLLPKINTEQIYMKDFSLPVFQNKKYIFNLKDIEEKPTLLSQPLIIKKNNDLFCNYKKKFFNPGPLSPELFNKLCHLKIFSFVNESLSVEIDRNYENKINDDEEENINTLEDNKDIQYMKLQKTHIDPNSVIDIDFSFPPANTSNKEKFYRLLRNLKVSNNHSSINILIEIVFIVYPIQIFFSCEKYSLTYDNKQYKLNARKLLKGENIKFQIKNNNDEIPLKIKYSIKSLENNTSDKPDFQSSDSNEFNLIIKQNDNNNNIQEIEILHCLIEIYIAKEIKIPMLIDSLIISTYFDFYIYDYASKTYVTNKMNVFIPTFEQGYKYYRNI